MKLFIAISLSLIAVVAHAGNEWQIENDNDSASAAFSGSSAAAFGGNQEQQQQMIFAPTNEAADLGDVVPSIGLAALHQAVKTCFGSWTSGVGISGFGIGAGGPVEDEGCAAAREAYILSQLVGKQTALLRMCDLAGTRKAVGFRAAQMGTRSPCYQYEQTVGRELQPDK